MIKKWKEKTKEEKKKKKRRTSGGIVVEMVIDIDQRAILESWDREQRRDRYHLDPLEKCSTVSTSDPRRG